MYTDTDTFNPHSTAQTAPPDTPSHDVDAVAHAPPAQVIEQALAPNRGVTEATLIEWFMKWRKPIRSWLRNRASVPNGDIDDLAQEVFLRLLRYSQEAVVDNPQGYLFRIASNVANEWRERSRIKKPHDPAWLDELLLDDEHQPELIHERAMNNATVQAAINELPPRQRLCLLDHAINELTYKQIAEIHGLTYRIVLRDLTRAYSSLRIRLENPPQ